MRHYWPEGRGAVNKREAKLHKWQEPGQHLGMT